MIKMTKAAELYLKDFHILSEAREELDLFLNHLVDQVYEILDAERESLNGNEYDWKIWKNKAKPGTMELYLSPTSSNIEPLRKNQTDIFVTYYDIRHTARIKNPMSIEIDVRCTRRAKQLRTILNKESLDLFDSEATVYYYPSIHPAEIDKTVDKIATQMLDCCQRINQILESLRRMKAL